MKMKSRSHRYNINWPRSRYNYSSKYKYDVKYLSMVMLICIKPNLSIILSSIHEKVKQHWGWFEKKLFL